MDESRSRVRMARIYDQIDPDDGPRVLGGRVWARGVRKDPPRGAFWLKDVAPSNELRTWYHHQLERFDEFAARYEVELAGNPTLEELRELSKQGVVTLVTASRHLDGSHATVLAKLLKSP